MSLGPRRVIVEALDPQTSMARQSVLRQIGQSMAAHVRNPADPSADAFDQPGVFEVSLLRLATNDAPPASAWEPNEGGRVAFCVHAIGAQAIYQRAITSVRNSEHRVSLYALSELAFMRLTCLGRSVIPSAPMHRAIF